MSDYVDDLVADALTEMGSKRDKKVRLIFTHNAGNPPLHQWLREAKRCLLKNEKAKDIGNSIQICYRQPKNLKRIITQTKFSRPKVDDPGCRKCGRCRVACPVLKEGNTFTSTNTGRSYRIRQSLDCNSSFVIYLSTCLKCGGQYVGKSQTPFKLRHSNHRQEIKKQINEYTPIPLLFLTQFRQITEAVFSNEFQ